MSKFNCLFALPILITLFACTDEQVQQRDQTGMLNGHPVYTFKNELVLGPKTTEANLQTARAETIVTHAKRLCPNGYRELSRTEPKIRNNSYNYPIGGIMIYKTQRLSSVEVTINCTG